VQAALARCFTIIGILLALTQVAAADEQLVMPFACHAANGRIELVSSASTAYRIYGTAERQQFTVCSPIRPGLCRTWLLHRFNMDCGGVKVAWLSVVDAVASQWAPTRAWASNGRLHLQMGRWWSNPPMAPCNARRRFGEARTRFYQFGSPCAQPFRPSAPQIVDLPAGFAPALAGFARIVSAPGTLDDPKKAAPPMPRLSTTASGEPVELRAQGPEETPEAITPPTPLTQPAPAGAALAHTHPLGRIEISLALALIVLLSGTLFLLGWSVGPKAAQRDAAGRSRGSGTPLQRRPEQPHHGLAESADWLPRTKSEALHILGLSQSAKTNLIRMTVRRLRQTWHPDLAGNAEDRRVRDQKLKQINVAWDIISGKRAERFA
jgi:hypothetical protein